MSDRREEGVTEASGESGWFASEAWSLTDGWGGGIGARTVVDQIARVGAVVPGPLGAVPIAAVAAEFMINASMLVLIHLDSIIDNYVEYTAIGVAVVAAGSVLGFLTAALAPLRAATLDGWHSRDVGSVVRRCLRRWKRGMLGLVVWFVGSIVGVLLLLLPGLFYGFVFGGVPYLAATTSLGIWECFERSFRLAKRHWRGVLVGFIACSAMFGVLQVVDPAVLALVGAESTESSRVARHVSQVVEQTARASVSLLILFVQAAVWTAIDSREDGWAAVAEATGESKR
ncbi:MAG: hypothetical protein ABEL76_11710 [Bradymonadaceae bacterium]